MAGTTNRHLISVEDAKARLLELSGKPDQPAGLLASPLVRLGAALLAGAYLGRRLRKPRRNDRAAPLIATMLSSMASTAAPMLIEQLLRGVMGHTKPGGGDDTTA